MQIITSPDVTMMTVPDHMHLLLEVSMTFRCVRTLSHAVISLTDAFKTYPSCITICTFWCLDSQPAGPKIFTDLLNMIWPVLHCKNVMIMHVIVRTVKLDWPVKRCHNNSCEHTHCWTWLGLYFLATLINVSVNTVELGKACDVMLQ